MNQCQYYEVPDKQCANATTTGDYCDDHQPPAPRDIKALFHTVVGIAEIINAAGVVYEFIEWTIHTVPFLAMGNEDFAKAKLIQDHAETIRNVAELVDAKDHEMIDDLRTQLESVIDRAEVWEAQVKNKMASQKVGDVPDLFGSEGS